MCYMLFSCFFFNDTATTEIYTLSLHDALPICPSDAIALGLRVDAPLYVAEQVLDQAAITLDEDEEEEEEEAAPSALDRKSTRLNSSHANISYAVFCLKKKKKKNRSDIIT